MNTTATSQVKKAMRCGYCPRIILPEGEVGGRLHIARGKPICPTCRIMHGSKFSKQIQGDKKNYQKDKEVKEKVSNDKELKKNMEIAAASQEQAGEKARNKKK